MFNNYQAINTFQQAYQMYASAAQYISAREAYINQTITKIEIENKIRLQKLDAILADYGVLYREIEQEATRYSNNRLLLNTKISKIEDEVKKFDDLETAIRILLVHRCEQDVKIVKLEEEVVKLKKDLEEIRVDQSHILKQTKHDLKDKISLSARTENITNNDVNDVIISKQPVASSAKAENVDLSLMHSELTKDDQVKESLVIEEITKFPTKRTHKFRQIRPIKHVQNINDCNASEVNNNKEEIKNKVKVGARLLNQSNNSIDCNKNVISDHTEQTQDKVEDPIKYSMQSKETSKKDVKDVSSKNEKSCGPKDTNLIATKGKNWNNHDIDAWLQQKLNLNVKERAWKVTVFGEYQHVEFNASDSKHFLWEHKDEWEKEGLWIWFEY